MGYVPSIKGPLLAVVALATIIALPFGCTAGGAYTEALPRPFNSNKWKIADGDDRCGMIIDLQNRIGIVGRSESELAQLLGPAEDHDKDIALSHWHLCPSFMDVWILEVRWQNGRAVSAKVRDT